MRAVIQRVSQATLVIKDTEKTESIGKGIVVLLGISKEDTEKDIYWIAEKIVSLRIFPNDRNKMSLSLFDVSGDLLIISQFTLYGDCKKGRRPDFTRAASLDTANKLYDRFLEVTRNKISQLKVKSGVFGAYMSVNMVNDGPVTILLDSKIK